MQTTAVPEGCQDSGNGPIDAKVYSLLVKIVKNQYPCHWVNN